MQPEKVKVFYNAFKEHGNLVKFYTSMQPLATTCDREWTENIKQLLTNNLKLQMGMIQKPNNGRLTCAARLKDDEYPWTEDDD